MIDDDGTLRVSWRVLRYDSPAPDQDPDYRGADVLAVPGDTLVISTPDGSLMGEPVGELFFEANAFLMIAGGGDVYAVSAEKVTWLDLGEDEA